MGKNRVRLQSKLVLSTVLLGFMLETGALPVIYQGVKAQAEVYFSYSPEDEDCDVSSTKGDSDEDSGDSSPSVTASGDAKDFDWLTEGTVGYKNAKDTWDYWKTKGLDGSMIAGIIGNIGGAENTTFTLDLKEAGGGSGGGLYQFTPYTKYSNWSGFDGKWSAKNQIDYILSPQGEPQTVQKYIEQGKGKSPSENAKLWAELYERPLASALSASLQARKDYAEKAYDKFGGSKVKFDSDKVAKWSGGGSDSSSKSNENESSDTKGDSPVDIDKAIQWYKDHKGKVSYSMVSRDGPSSYDCSSSLYYALTSAGASDNGYAVSTESEHDWLEKNGYEKVYEGDWSENGEFGNVQKGDIFVWGERGASSGAGGHTGMFIDENTIIHCNFGNNGITEDAYENYKTNVHAGLGKVYIYRPNGGTAKSEEPDEVDCVPDCDTETESSSSSSTSSNTDDKTSTSGVSSGLVERIDSFVKAHKEAYLNSWKVGGFLPSASIVQTIAEVGFDENVPSFGQAHNLGGVKFSGQDYTATKKLYGKDAVSGNGPGTSVGDGTGGGYAYFKSYDAGIVGKAEFMATQDLYNGAINNTDGKSTLSAIADGGWATDPSYKSVLHKLYDEYGSKYKWLDEEAIKKHGKSPFKKSDKGNTEGLSGDDSSSKKSPDDCGDGSSSKAVNAGYLFDVPYTFSQGYGRTSFASTSSAYFSIYGDYIHGGVDIVTDQGVGPKIYSPVDATVKYAGTYPDGAHVTVLTLPDGEGELLFAHLNEAPTFLKVGQEIKAGDHIGNLGNSGMSTGPHLHFEWNMGDSKSNKNPEKFLKGLNGKSVEGDSIAGYRIDPSKD